MITKITDLQQATLADIQEKIAETQELLKREEEFARRHQTMMERRLDNAIKIGQNLCYFKATLPHGKFITFVQVEFGISQSTAWDYMNLAGQGANHGRVHDLPLRTEFELASPSTPPEVIEMVETKQIPPTVEAIREAKRNVDNIPLAVPHISSKNNEWYTPAKYVEAARQLMGWIDCDPASCAEANEVIQATVYYDNSTNGLDKDWIGCVWLNPPYGYTNGKSNQELWSSKLIERYADGQGVTTEAVLLVNAAVDTRWFQRLLAYPVCLTLGRINFSTPEPVANGSTHGSAFVYFGSQNKRFVEIFRQFGEVVRRWEE
jgi:hypothetical protein